MTGKYPAGSRINGAQYTDKALAMTLHAQRGPTSTGCALVLGLLCVAPVGSLATTPIYKCFDKNLGLLYTDEPCKDGELLNIRAGDADPAAVARLERARDALDQSAAQRIAANRWAAAQRDFAPWYSGPRESAFDYAAANSPYDYSAVWGLTGLANGRPPHARPRGMFNSRGFAFSGQNMGGR
jgi:hypothetical protein